MYCIEIWGSENKTTLDCVIKLQKKSHMDNNFIWLKKPYYSLFQYLQILKFEDVYQCCFVLLMYKIHNGMLTRMVNELFTLNSKIHSYSTGEA